MNTRTALSLQNGLGTLQEKVNDALRLAKQLGASQAEANASFGTGFSVNVRSSPCLRKLLAA